VRHLRVCESLPHDLTGVQRKGRVWRKFHGLPRPNRKRGLLLFKEHQGI
jgi:hypothetical protein